MTNNLLLTFVAFLSVGCAKSDGIDDAETIDAIESQLRLPNGADSLEDYARYYGPNDDGLVIGTLITRQFYKPDNPGYDLPVGQRRWLPHANYLPSIGGGGCGVVMIWFDPKTKSMEVECNGDH